LLLLSKVGVFPPPLNGTNDFPFLSIYPSVSDRSSQFHVFSPDWWMLRTVTGLFYGVVCTFPRYLTSSPLAPRSTSLPDLIAHFHHPSRFLLVVAFLGNCAYIAFKLLCSREESDTCLPFFARDEVVAPLLVGDFLTRSFPFRRF